MIACPSPALGQGPSDKFAAATSLAAEGQLVNNLRLIYYSVGLCFKFLLLVIACPSPSRLYKPPREQGLSEESVHAASLAWNFCYYSVGLCFKFLLSTIACPSPTACSIIARTFSGRPNNVIKPSASLWL